MNEFPGPGDRLAAVVHLVQRLSPRGGVGRTALMKLLYLTQVLEHQPFGYEFGLYTYGPYDAQVLEDLKLADVLGAAEQRVEEYDFGRGYRITAGAGAAALLAATPLPAASREALDRVVGDFGGRTARELEMIGTVVFLDRLAQRRGEHPTAPELARRVHEVKPHLAETMIQTEIAALRSGQRLLSLT